MLDGGNVGVNEVTAVTKSIRLLGLAEGFRVVGVRGNETDVALCFEIGYFEWRRPSRVGRKTDPCR